MVIEGGSTLAIPALMSSMLFAFCFISFTVILYIFTQKEKTPGIHIIGFLFFAIFLYTLSYSFELSCQTLNDKIFFNHIQYCGLSFVGPLWYMLSKSVIDKNIRWKLSQIALLSIAPLLTLYFNFTYTENWLFYSSSSLVEYQGVTLRIFQK